MVFRAIGMIQYIIFTHIKKLLAISLPSLLIFFSITNGACIRKSETIVRSRERLTEPQVVTSKFLEAIKSGQEERAYLYVDFNESTSKKTYSFKKTVRDWLKERNKIERFKFVYYPVFWHGNIQTTEEKASEVSVYVDFVYDINILPPNLRNNEVLRSSAVWHSFQIKNNKVHSIEGFYLKKRSVERYLYQISIWKIMPEILAGKK